MLHFKTGVERQLTLYNSKGIRIWASTISGTTAEIDMRHYTSGSYLMQIEHPKGRQVLRFVKE